jgi:hypothetical protein
MQIPGDDHSELNGPKADQSENHTDRPGVGSP